MSRITKIMRLFNTGLARDNEFESYYAPLARSRYQGGPSAAEARRDFEVIRRTVDKAVIF